MAFFVKISDEYLSIQNNNNNIINTISEKDKICYTEPESPVPPIFVQRTNLLKLSDVLLALQ